MDFDMWASLNALQKRQQAQQGAEASAEIAAEIRKLQAMLQEEANKPKCPWCGGGLEKGYEFCKHCGNPVLWVGNLVGKPEQEAEMQAAYLQWQEQKEKKRIAKAEQARRKAESKRRKEEKQKQELDRLRREREQWEQTDEYAEWRAERDLRKAKEAEADSQYWFRIWKFTWISIVVLFVAVICFWSLIHLLNYFDV